MDPLFATVIFLLGLAFGSFLNVCIYRLPRDLSIVRPRSACPRCGTPIRARDNIPVFSWLLLRGRCRRCRAAISPRYLVVELITALLFLGCYARFDLTLLTAKFCVLVALLIALIFTDAETKLLPDSLTLPGLAAGVLFSVFVPVNDLAARLAPGLVPIAARPEAWRVLSLADSLLGALLGASFIYGAGMIYKLTRHIEGMGFGDVKLMAMIGAFLGIKLTAFTIFGASVLGSAFGLGTVLYVWIKRTRRRMARNRESAAVARKRAWQSARVVYRHYEMPFGVFLGSMAIVAFFFGSNILGWYWSLYS